MNKCMKDNQMYTRVRHTFPRQKMYGCYEGYKHFH